MKYDKIVRDRIPEIIRNNNSTCEVSYVDDKTAIRYLVKKIHEEADEFEKSSYSKEEMADMFEVLYAIMSKLKIKESSITQIRNKKSKDNGVFKNNIILKNVEKVNG